MKDKGRLIMSEYEYKNIIDIIEKNKKFLMKELKNESKSTYNFSYPYLLNYFGQIKKGSTSQWLICGSSMVYSWMPTILNFNFEQGRIDHATNSLKEIKKLVNNKPFDFNRPELPLLLNPIVTVINNSIVGVSKFLHFSYPEIFPIWDSRVERAFSGKPNNYHQVKSIKNYIQYSKSIHKVVDEKKNDWIANELFNDSNNNLSPIRKIESMLFLLGKNTNKQK